MRARGPILAGSAIAAVAVVSVLAWPSIADRTARGIERRLREETGRSWRIESVGLALRPGPQIVLKNVAVGDDRAGSGVFGVRIREVRLTDPVSLVLGSGDSGHGVAEGLNLRAPLVAEAGPKAAPRTDEPATIASPRKGGTVRIGLQGVEVALSESGGAVTASADTLDFTFDRTAPQDHTEIRASLDGKDLIATVSLDLPVSGEASGPFTLGLDPRGPNGRSITANARASLKPAALKLDAVSGKIDGQAFAGDLEVGWGGPKPKVVLNARLDALTLTDETNAARLENKPSDKGTQPSLVVPVTTAVIPDLRWFSGFEGSGSLNVERLALGPVRLASVDLAGTVKDGGLDAALASASGYEGTARGRYVLTPDADGAGRHQLGVSLKGVRVRPLLRDVAGAGGIDGSGTLRVDLQAKGAQVDAIKRSLQGSADLAVTDGRIDGLDVAGLIGLIPSDRARRGGLGTRLDRLAGSFSLTEGQAVTNDLVLKTALIEAAGIGSLDLIGQTLDVRLKPQVVRPDAGRPSTGRNPLDVPIRIVGPWDHPAVSADLSGLAANPSGVLDSLQDLGNGILNGQGLDGKMLDGRGVGPGGGDAGDLGEAIGQSLGGLLDGLLGKPQRRPPGPRRAPAPDDPDSPQ